MKAIIHDFIDKWSKIILIEVEGYNICIKNIYFVSLIETVASIIFWQILIIEHL